MADAISIQELIDARTDAKTLEEAVNGDAVTTVLSRLGETYPTLSNALNQIDSKLDSADTQIKQAITDLFQNGGLPAEPFETKAQMEIDGAVLADGHYAMVTDDTDNNGLYVKTSGAWVKSAYDPVGQAGENVKKYIDADDVVAGYAAVWTDDFGNIALGIKDDATVVIPKLQGGSSSVATSTTKVTVGDSDAILMIGDSFTASFYVPADKAYISNLSNFSDYRFKNTAISGNDTLDMNSRIVNNTAYFDGLTQQNVNAKYAIIAAYENDSSYFRNRNEYFVQNMARLIASVKALGIEPILATEFTATAQAVSTVKQIADSHDIRFIDCTAIDNEIGKLKKGLFHQGHPAVRTNAVFWLPMLDAISKLPTPKNSIKIYRKRTGFAAGALSDLLYKNTSDRYKKFREISVSHMRLSNGYEQYYDEMESPNVAFNSSTSDEYLKLGGTGVTFSDYGLIELIADGTAQTIDSLTIDIDADAQVYIRNYLDVATSFLGKSDGGSSANADYLARWDNPVGAWKAQPLGKLTLSGQQLKGLMVGDKIQILLYKSGGFTLNNVQFEYNGGGKVDNYIEHKPKRTGSQLLTNNTFDSLANWTTTGSPSTLVPIDNYNSPRLPSDRTLPVNNVVTVSNTNTIGRSVVLPKVNTKYRVTVWARYFPKAFIDNSAGLYDAAQVIDRSTGKTYPADAPITSDTADIRTLAFKYNLAATFTEKNSLIVRDFACLGWRGIEFDIYISDAPLGTTDFTFNISCPDGEIQIAKIELVEVI